MFHTKSGSDWKSRTWLLLGWGVYAATKPTEWAAGKLRGEVSREATWSVLLLLWRWQTCYILFVVVIEWTKRHVSMDFILPKGAMKISTVNSWVSPTKWVLKTLFQPVSQATQACWSTGKVFVANHFSRSWQVFSFTHMSLKGINNCWSGTLIFLLLKMV